MLDPIVKTALLTALSEMISRVQATSGLHEDEVITIIGTYFANDAEAIDNTNTTKLVSPKGSYLAAKAAIAEWVDAAPDVLDTINEIAAALNNDPDAFNTLMGEITQNRTGLTNLAGRFTRVWDTDTEFFTRTELQMEDIAYGVYHGQAKPALLGSLAAEPLNALVPTTPVSLTIRVISFYNNDVTPTVGEEERRLFMYQAQQGATTLVGVLDTRSAPGTGIVWSRLGAGAGDAAGNVSFTDINSLVDTAANINAKLKALDNGGYYSTIQNSSGEAITWLEVSNYDPYDATKPHLVQVVITDDPDNPGEKIAVYTVTTNVRTYILYYKTVDSSKTFFTPAYSRDIEESMTDIAIAFSRVARATGDIVDTFGKVYDKDFYNPELFKLSFISSGEYIIYKGTRELQRGYWLPFQANAADYRIKRTDVTGNAEAGSTLTAAYMAIPAIPASCQVQLASTADQKQTITFQHIPSTKETAVDVELKAIV